MAQWDWISPFHSDQSLMEEGPNPRNEASEGHGKDNFGFRKTEEDSQPDPDDLVQFSVTEEEVPDYETDIESPDYDDEPQVGGGPSTGHEGHERDEDLESSVFENDLEEVLSISSKPEDCATSGIESFENRTGSFEDFKVELNEVYEDELETRSVRTMDPETVRIKTRTWKRGVAPLLVQGANTIRLRRKEVEAAKEEVEAEGQRPQNKADFTSFIDGKKKQSMAVEAEESKREKRKKRRTGKWKHFRSKIKDLFGIFALWTTTLKEIEGHFGGATVSYFRFVKWLLLVNLLSSFVITCSTLLPEVILHPKHFQETVNCSAYPTTNTTTTSLSPTTIMPFTNGTIDTGIPPDVGNTSSEGNYRGDIGIREACWCTEIYENGIESPDGRMWYLIILDILQGTEWMELSVLFLGYYFDKPLYLSSLAFLFATMVCFVVILWIIVLYIASSLRTNIIESPGANKQRYSNQVFGCWDHTLTYESAAASKKNQIYCTIRREMEKDEQYIQKKQMSRRKRVGIFILRLIVAILISALIAAAGFFLYFLVTSFVPELRKIVIADAGLKELFNLLLQYLPSIALTFINAILPRFFQLFLKLAILTEETEFAVLLVLMIFTRLSSVAFLIITLFTQIYSCQSDTKSNICNTCPEMPCWENRLGQQMYTLAIIDFLIVFVSFLVTIIFGRCCCALLQKKMGDENGKDGRVEFDVSAEVLSAVYTQTICWIGAFFCPLILPITAVKLFIFFYMKKKSLFCCCVPSSRINSASRLNFFFMIAVLTSLIICYFTVTFAIGWLHPSQGCSPFRVYSEADYYMYRSFPFAILSWSNSAKDFFRFISSWAFFSIISIASIFFICLFSVMASRNRKIARQLAQQILLESQDKLFLYRRAQKAYFRNELDT